MKKSVNHTIKWLNLFNRIKTPQDLEEEITNLLKEQLERVNKEVRLSNSKSFWIGMSSGIRRFSKSGYCGEPSPKEGLTIKQYLENVIEAEEQKDIKNIELEQRQKLDLIKGEMK